MTHDPSRVRLMLAPGVVDGPHRAPCAWARLWRALQRLARRAW